MSWGCHDVNLTEALPKELRARGFTLYANGSAADDLYHHGDLVRSFQATTSAKTIARYCRLRGSLPQNNKGGMNHG